MDQVEQKKQLAEDQIVYRQVHAMSNRQMSKRLKRLARKRDSSNIDSIYAIVYSLVFDNTKPNGPLEPYLR